MTLFARNAFFKAGIILAAVSLLAAVAATFIVMPDYPLMDTENVRRPAEILQSFFSLFFRTDYYAVHIALGAAVLYSLAAIILIFYYFEQTQTPEILFIAFFSVSFLFETARLVIPLHMIRDIPGFYLLVASRVLLFGRYFGIISIFAASVCAAGLEIQKTHNIILTITAVTLVITLGVPIDTQSWDSSFSMIDGYTSLFRLIEAVIFLSTAASFFIAVKVRGSKEYAFVAIGALLALAGRNILLSADNWASPGPGIVLLSVGTWFICSRLHRIYLWL